jgi:hypothetical protein
MNIIQISEQLKDVPDQFLMQEIQNPTGSYPSYLVVSELTRRKRMRDGAIKQEPTTSVAEDLVGISSTPEAAQSTLGAAQQMMAQPMPEMGVNVPEMGMNQTPMMADGGLVAFENGGPIRAQAGLFVDPTQLISEPGAPLQFKVRDRFTGGIYNEMAGLKKAGFTDAEISQMSPEQRTQMFRSVQKESTGVPSGAEIERRMAPAMAQPTQQSPVATGASAQQKIAGEGAPPPRAGGLGAFKMPEFPTAQYEAAMGMPMPTEAEIAGTRKRAGEEFEQTMPDRTSQLLNERILRKTEQLQKDKDMTFNEALFAAGAAILSAPGGGGMKWAGEGLKAFGQTMAQGKKDIRKSQDLIDQANIDLAQAQSLRDQGKLAAADKAETKAFDRFAQGRALAQSDAALSLQQFNARVTAAKAPYEIDESQSKAEAQRALAGVYRSGGAGALTAAAKANQPMSAMEVEMAKARVLSDPRYKNASPETVDQMLKQMYGDRYVALPALPPLIRGAETGGATLPGT